MQDALLLSAARTPIGSFLGALSSLPAPKLGAAAIRAALERCGLDPDRAPDGGAAAPVDQVIFGNVLQAGIGQAPARQATLFSGLPNTVGAITLHKVCGSGMRAVMDAANGVRAQEWELVVAGGQESMSNAPHLLPKSREGTRMGPWTALDSMVHDGLWDPYLDQHMGNCAELCAERYRFSREEQDAFARESYRRARAAQGAGDFAAEITAVSVPRRKGDPLVVDADEEPGRADLDKMPSLRPAFAAQGTITAANASKINDGAAALVVASEARARALGIEPWARVVSQASVAGEPQWFTTAPAAAARLALQRAGLRPAEIDRWEVNEAFAVVAMAFCRDLELDPATVNVRGGAVALGHPIGCSGARILVTLLHVLRQEKLRYGCATICIGGGEATAMVVENLAR